MTLAIGARRRHRVQFLVALVEALLNEIVRCQLHPVLQMIGHGAGLGFEHLLGLGRPLLRRIKRVKPVVGAGEVRLIADQFDHQLLRFAVTPQLLHQGHRPRQNRLRTIRPHRIGLTVLRRPLGRLAVLHQQKRHEPQTIVGFGIPVQHPLSHIPDLGQVPGLVLPIGGHPQHINLGHFRTCFGMIRIQHEGAIQVRQCILILSQFDAAKALVEIGFRQPRIFVDRLGKPLGRARIVPRVKFLPSRH